MASANENGEGAVGSNLVEQFCAITGASKVRAESLLEACTGNLEMAINMHMESDDVGDGIPESFAGPSGEGGGGGTGGRASSPDEVRAPIPPTRGVLVEPQLYAPSTSRSRMRAARVHSVFDGLRDFQAETMEQEERVRQGLPIGFENSKQKRLEDLFRPPLDLTFSGNFQAAKDSGSRENKWLLVNIQNNREFKCQVLNRDVWSDKRIKALVRENFIFWQVFSDSEDGLRFSNFYPFTSWPYIAILDPRTGENLVQWHETDVNALYQALTEFLGDHSVPSDSIVPPKKPRTDDAVNRSVVDMSEDSQIEAAIKASLAETHAPKPESENGSDLEAFSDSEDTNSSFPSPYVAKFKSSTAGGAGGSDAAKDGGSGAGGGATASDVPKRNLGDFKGGEEKKTENGGEERWKKHLGDEKDPPSKLLLRLPDGKKVHVSMPSSSRIQAVISYAESLGFPSSEYEIVTSFPRKIISDLPAETTLKDAGLFPQETVFVQAR